ncbi:hypothetical protein ACN4EK_04445 [Pantanalinema rosaneae CENA516]|uniref:hypothetical protein n=1 Tax=Pantanalinema rosaneae TaxID=1620701 RepID=UPI003D6DEA8D
MKPNELLYRQLELITDPIADSRGSQSIPQHWLSKAWQFLTNLLMVRSELQIIQTPDRTGQLWWYIYDPSTGQTAWLESEDEVRIWIEKRYSRPTFERPHNIRFL